MSLNAWPTADGDVTHSSDQLILADFFQAVSVTGLSLGDPMVEDAVHITFAGALNDSEDRADVTIVLSRDATLKITDALLDAVEASK